MRSTLLTTPQLTTLSTLATLERFGAIAADITGPEAVRMMREKPQELLQRMARLDERPLFTLFRLINDRDGISLNAGKQFNSFNNPFFEIEISQVRLSASVLNGVHKDFYQHSPSGDEEIVVSYFRHLADLLEEWGGHLIPAGISWEEWLEEQKALIVEEGTGGDPFFRARRVVESQAMKLARIQESCFQANDTKGALKAMAEAIAVLEEMEDGPECSLICDEIVGSLIHHGFPEAGQQILEDEIAAVKKLDDPYLRAESLFDVAATLKKFGWEDRFEECFWDSIAAARAISDPMERIRAFLQTAELLIMMMMDLGWEKGLEELIGRFHTEACEEIRSLSPLPRSRAFFSLADFFSLGDKKLMGRLREIERLTWDEAEASALLINGENDEFDRNEFLAEVRKRR